MGKSPDVASGIAAEMIAQDDVREKVLAILDRLLTSDVKLEGERAVLPHLLSREIRVALCEFTNNESLKAKLQIENVTPCLTPEGIINKIMNAIRAIDEKLFIHCKKTAELAYDMGKILQADPNIYIPPLVPNNVLYGSKTHDVGKLYPPIENLASQNRSLSNEEKNIVDEHADLGSRVLKCLGLPEYVYAIARDHHHHAGGAHSPTSEEFAMSNLSWETRLTAVADSVEAMIAARPGNGIKSIGYVLKELKKDSKAGKLDEVVVNAFCQICEKLGYDENSDKVINTRQLLGDYYKLQSE